MQQIDSLRQHVQTLIVPADVSFFQRRSRIVGDAPLHWLSYGVGSARPHASGSCAGPTLSVIAQVRGYDMAVARAFDSVAQLIRGGLAAPFVCVSFAGDAASIRQWPASLSHWDACLSQRVTLHVASMSMSNALMVGAARWRSVSPAIPERSTPRRRQSAMPNPHAAAPRMLHTMHVGYRNRRRTSPFAISKDPDNEGSSLALCAPPASW